MIVERIQVDAVLLQRSLQVLLEVVQTVREDEILAFKFEGKRYDIGNKLDYLITEVEFAVEREDLGYEFRQFLKNFVKTLND